MAIVDGILPEFDQEMANTRKTLERIPDAKFDWKPHSKSMPMGDLGAHLATLPTFVAITMERDSFDVINRDGAAAKPPKPKSAIELVETFDKNVAAARAILEKTKDDHLMKPWTLLAGGKTILTLPRIAVLRSFVLSHNVHHRAQLGVYLRLNDVPVPSIYGPSADESGM